jgi:hypothetical protein
MVTRNGTILHLLINIPSGVGARLFTSSLRHARHTIYVFQSSRSAPVPKTGSPFRKPSEKRQAEAGSLGCYGEVRESGLSEMEVGRKPRMSRPAAGEVVKRAELANRNGLRQR